MVLALIIIFGVVIFDILAVAACISAAGDCSAQEEKIIYCENCKHWETENCSEGQGWCRINAGYRNEKWYCAAAEKKEKRT